MRALGLILITSLVAYAWMEPAPPSGMVSIPAGTFMMGSDAMPDEGPVRSVFVDGFYIDRYEVTNAEFARFVEATGYTTVAERSGPGGRLGSLVFAPEASRGRYLDWWRAEPTADWRHPEGEGSDLLRRSRHPVVHVAHEDARAYCTWRGARLPTEAEWERAARGGLEGARYVWGQTFAPGYANVWQGDFPTRNAQRDGYVRTAPVGSYRANGFGLFDMAGNVWEWTSDWYAPRYDPKADENPSGPKRGLKKVTRGGSFLCSKNHCARYRPSARSPTTPETSLAHTGFRCAKAQVWPAGRQRER